MLEKRLQEFLSAHNGRNLALIDPELLFIEQEYSFSGGRVDILAVKNGVPVGIELKAGDYRSKEVCAQLLNYINLFSKKDGIVYFIAPKVKPGIFSTLQPYNHMTRFFEYNNYSRFYEVFSSTGKGANEVLFPEIYEGIIYRSIQAPAAKFAGRIIKKILGL